jgi:hypothetical protein
LIDGQRTELPSKVSTDSWPRVGKYLVAVVAGVLLLAAVPGNVPGSVALVAAILLLQAFAGEVAEPIETFKT